MSAAPLRALRAPRTAGALLVFFALLARAQPRPPPAPPPSDAECRGLALPRGPLPFSAGELLEYDLDALGAKAGTMTMATRPVAQGELPVEINVETNTFFSKVRRVRGNARSFMSPKTLRPLRYLEDTTENEIHRTAEVTFVPKEHLVRLRATQDGLAAEKQLRDLREVLDDAGAFALLRALAFRKEMSLCSDVYGLRRLWRVYGKVVAREHVSLPVGEFDAWHLKGEAVRLDDYSQRREVHLWISDDARRLPLVAVGAIDLGVVRATLKAFKRPHEKAVREDKGQMRW